MVWRRESAALHRLCRALLGGREQDADEAMGRVALRVAQYRGAPVIDAGAWLRSIARNVCIDLLREQERQRCHPLDDCGEVALSDWHTPEAIHLREERVHRLECAMSTLPAPLFRLVRLRYFDELSLDQVAQQRGMSEANVRRWMREACRRLEVSLRANPVGAKTAEATEEDNDYGVDVPSCVAGLQFTVVPTSRGDRDVYWLLAEPPLRYSVRAIPKLNRYIARHPNGWRKRLALARLLRGRGALADAMAHYSEVVRRRPVHVLAWLELYECGAVFDGAKAAAPLLRAAARSVRSEVSPLFSAFGDADRLRDLAAQTEGNSYLWCAAARAYAARACVEEAGHAYERALALDPRNPILLALSADARLAAGDDGEARARLEQALAADPSCIVALQCEIRRRSRGGKQSDSRDTVRLVRRLRALAGHATETVRVLAEYERSRAT